MTSPTVSKAPTVITIFNNKGGVGKTTLLCNLAAALKLNHGKRVLVVDADPQCNATAYLLTESTILDIYSPKPQHTVEQFLEPLRRGQGYLTSAPDVMHSPRFDVDLLPGDPRLALSEDLLASDWKSGSSGDPRGLQTTFVFADLVQHFSDGYDFIFFDVGPALGAINRAVLLASDYFLVPMSSDIFSLMAIGNISTALMKWKEALQKGLTEYHSNEGAHFTISAIPAAWRLKFVGYVGQQYTAKAVKGKRQPVKAYDRILKQAPERIRTELVVPFRADAQNFNPKLGEIPNLHSVVPLSQSANAPVFALKAKDGVVGAHFAKVAEAGDIYAGIADRLIENLE